MADITPNDTPEKEFMNKTAIVIGATGLVGKELVIQLASAPFIEKVVAVARRPVNYGSAKISNQVVDFDNLDKYAEVFKADYLFSALGTTLKQAGSQEAQYKVDFEYQLKAAQLASVNDVPHYLLVSAAMANANSRNFYTRLKGELELKVKELPFKRVSIFQPGLLIGEREHERTGEKIAGAILPLVTLIPGLHKFRPIRGEQVAARMIQVSQTGGSARETFQLEDVFPN